MLLHLTSEANLNVKEKLLHSHSFQMALSLALVKSIKSVKVTSHGGKALESFIELIFTLFLQLYDRFFSSKNNPKNLDLSYKTDLDLWDCLGRVKLDYGKITLDLFGYLQPF